MRWKLPPKPFVLSTGEPRFFQSPGRLKSIHYVSAMIGILWSVGGGLCSGLQELREPATSRHGPDDTVEVVPLAIGALSTPILLMITLYP